MSTSGLLKTLAFHQSAQGKSGRMPELSVQPARVPAPQRQEVAHEHQRIVENLGFSPIRPRKVGQDARVFRATSKSDSLPRSMHGFHRRGRGVKAVRRGYGETVRETAALTGQR